MFRLYRGNYLLHYSCNYKLIHSNRNKLIFNAANSHILQKLELTVFSLLLLDITYIWAAKQTFFDFLLVAHIRNAGPIKFSLF